MKYCSLKIDYILKENSVVILSFYDNVYCEYIPQIKSLLSQFKENGENRKPITNICVITGEAIDITTE